MHDIAYRRLAAESLVPALFEGFDRFQQVWRCWRKCDGRWQLKAHYFIEEWEEADLAELAAHLCHTLATGGAVWGAFEGQRLCGFASVEGPPMGSRGQYRQLSSLHTSFESRGRGIGRALMGQAARWARDQGGEKLYISAHSAEETQAFYKAQGCVEAREYLPELVAHEPFDCQLELVL